MSERNESALLAARMLGERNPEHLDQRVIAAAQVYATLALAVEVAELREALVAEFGPGGLAGVLDEIGVRIAPDGDSVAEAVVSLRAGEPGGPVPAADVPHRRGCVLPARHRGECRTDARPGR